MTVKITAMMLKLKHNTIFQNK